MYGNVEPSPGQRRVLEAGGEEDCDHPCPTEENIYEPLDPGVAAPSPKAVLDPPGTAWPAVTPKGSSRWTCPPQGPGVTPPPPLGCRWWVLVGATALGLSVLLNIILLTMGSWHITALTKEPEAEKAKELQYVASRSFLMYNQHHRKCVVAKGHQLTAATCQPAEGAQRFQWLRGGRLRGWASQRCVTALQKQNLSAVKLEPCREGDGRQSWECRGGGLLALAGHDLYFNYGNNVRLTVMLYSGDREWSRWLVHGTQDDVCSRACCPPCPKGWVYFRNSCYFYSETEASWEHAKSFCAALAAQLLEVESAAEREHLRAMLRRPAWLGITDQEAEGTWKRANGTVLPRESSWWHRNEPNGGLEENCAVLRPDGEWFDFPCTHQVGWVCEGPP